MSNAPLGPPAVVCFRVLRAPRRCSGPLPQRVALPGGSMADGLARGPVPMMGRWKVLASRCDGAAWVIYGTTGDALRSAGHKKDSSMSNVRAGGGPNHVGLDKLARYT